MRSSERLRRLIIGGGALLVVAFGGSAAYDGWRLRQQIERANDRELGNMAKALSVEAAQNFQAVDVVLRDAALWYESADRRHDAADLGPLLAARTRGVGQISVMTIIDANGLQRFRSRDTGEPLADVSDRPYFQVQRDRRDAGLFINEPVVTRSERSPALVVSRRLNRPDGSFDGVVAANVTLEQLRRIYAAIDLGEGSALTLTLDDGRLIVRQPPAPDDERRIQIPEFVALKGGPLVDRMLSPLDGRRKYVAVLEVGSQPLILAVTRDEEAALRPWRDEVQSGIVRTLLQTLLIVLAIYGLLRQLRRVESGDRAFRQSEERYAMAMEAANEGHAEWNIPEKTAFVSEKWCALHGIAMPPKVVHVSGLFSDIDIHPDETERVRDAVENHLEGRTPAIELEYRVRHPGGEWRWIHVRGRCLRERENDGSPLRLFCAATDVTERKEAEAAKAGYEARLNQAQRLEALGTLAGGIAHDFNNILGAILGFGEMAHQQAEPGTAMRRHLDRVMQAGARAKLLVRRILDFSRSGVAERVPVRMQVVVEEVVAMLNPTLPSHMGLRADLHAGDAAVTGDATQLYQVVMNLCTNAIQASGEQGVVDLGLRRLAVTHPTALSHGDLHSGEYIRLDVVDQGPGIAPDVLERMFDPFFTTKKVGEGTGLGLSLVHGIVSDLGGAIDVEAGSRGTRMTLWLPIGGEIEGRASSTVADAWPRGDGQTVMIVDDEPDLVELSEELLAGLGYEPVGYASAEAALRAFEADPDRFSAILSDEMLPGIHGTELARRVLAARPGLPVILMSGKVTAAMEQRALSAGVCSVLHKPLALREIAECLSDCLRAP